MNSTDFFFVSSASSERSFAKGGGGVYQSTPPLTSLHEERLPAPLVSAALCVSPPPSQSQFISATTLYPTHLNSGTEGVSSWCPLTNSSNSQPTPYLLRCLPLPTPLHSARVCARGPPFLGGTPKPRLPA
eukprot:Sspe_Gene.49213::Locus_26272_Transcript_1_1_Confidence_1.000_Length_404::g.49213::m.49213